MFCDKCGALLLPTHDSKQKRILKCTACGFSKAPSTENDYTLRHKIVHSERDVTVVHESTEELEHLPIAKAACLRCGFGRANYWQSLVQAQDADPTLFFRCRQCGHTWRDAR
ncbi:MAG: transcription factor S [Candidatus Heimdallarchaeota archaeon]